MRLLMIYCERFSYKPAVKNLDGAKEKVESATLNNALVGFIHLEPKDEDNMSHVETKLVKNLKWAARKNDTNSVVLHSFAHLAEDKADPEATRRLLNNAEERLKNSGYQTHQTPFGYFLDLDIQASGNSFARLFKEV